MLLLYVNVGYMQGQSDVRASTRLAPLAIDKNEQHRNNTHINVHELLSRCIGANFLFVHHSESVQRTTSSQHLSRTFCVSA